MYKKGDSGRHVREIQTLLKFQGFWTYPKITDFFGNVTEEAVKRFQKAKGLKADGVVGDITLSELLDGVDADEYTVDDRPDTDNKLKPLGAYKAHNGLEIDRHYLDDDEYVRDYGEVEIHWNYLHHTAGGHNPLRTAGNWNKDDRGRIATPYCIGGIGRDGDATYDGKVVETMPNRYIGWHLGKTGNFSMSKHSTATEINNYGYLTKKGGDFYNAYGSRIPSDQVIDLGFEFKGKRYWHNYTDLQMEKTELLMGHIAHIYPELPISNGLPALLRAGIHPAKAFDFNEDAYYGRTKGTWTHTNVRKGKMDCYPHPKLVEILKKL